MQLVDIQNITVGYGGAIVLPRVSFVISSGDFIGVIGPNGGGKTTLLRALLGRIKPMEGVIKCVEGLKIGYLPQFNTLDKSFPVTVRDVIESGSRTRDDIRRRVNELLDRTAMSDYANRSLVGLSGGELQRVLLCRALVDGPQLLVLDEPTTYVDSVFAVTFYDLLHRLNEEGMAILIVSHDLGTITQHVRTIACVNRNFHYHPSNRISPHQLALYNCPLQLIRHGDVPHTVLPSHE